MKKQLMIRAMAISCLMVGPLKADDKTIAQKHVNIIENSFSYTMTLESDAPKLKLLGKSIMLEGEKVKRKSAYDDVLKKLKKGLSKGSLSESPLVELFGKKMMEEKGEVVSSKRVNTYKHEDFEKMASTLRIKLKFNINKEKVSDWNKPFKYKSVREEGVNLQVLCQVNKYTDYDSLLEFDEKSSRIF